MNTETKICKNCHSSFIIEPDDFGFYEKIKISPPTWCPECRAMRRVIWRNERILYKRPCNAPGHTETIISNYSPEVPMPIYDQKYWWGDGWDAMEYGREYDFSTPFFEQFKKLLDVVPLPNVANLQAVNSDYCNFTYQSKNCYLNFASDINEDTAYLYHTIKSKDSFDLAGCQEMTQCSQSVHSEKSFSSMYLLFSSQCINARLMFNCHNCQDSFGCVNRRNVRYQIFNQQYSKEDYHRELEQMNMGSHAALEKQLETFRELILTQPHRFAQTLKVENVTGDYIINAKNCHYCFDVDGPAENLKYVTYSLLTVKDCYDGYGLGIMELGYEIVSAGDSGRNILFSPLNWTGDSIFYSHFCGSNSYLFGCVGLRNKKYCILNKQYTKEEYEKLVPRIIEHMGTDYGEFFPPNLSPFAYNETIAQEYFPLTKDEAIKKGYRWKDSEARHYEITKKPEDLPDHIKDIDEKILTEVIGCQHAGTCNEQCTTAFKIIPQELQFYQRMNLPLPRLCPNCRHYARLAQRNPLKLWHRSCMKEGCENEFETSYAPDRKETVYCETCYQAEIA